MTENLSTAELRLARFLAANRAILTPQYKGHFDVMTEAEIEDDLAEIDAELARRREADGGAEERQFQARRSLIRAAMRVRTLN